MPSPTENKANARAFYELLFNACRPAEAIARYAGDVYIQHNTHVADGKQAFIDYFERMAREYPGKHVTIKRAFAEDDHVVLHCHQVWPGGLEYAGIDIFRFDEAGKVVEHASTERSVRDREHCRPVPSSAQQRGGSSRGRRRGGRGVGDCHAAHR